MIREVFLDLNKVKLFGTENKKSDRVIEAVSKGIEMGDIFPPVPVCQVGDDEFELLESNYGGGHHRAIGHYIVGKPLWCIVIDTCNKFENGRKRTFIGDIELVNDDKAFAPYWLVSAHNFYR